MTAGKVFFCDQAEIFLPLVAVWNSLPTHILVPSFCTHNGPNSAEFWPFECNKVNVCFVLADDCQVTFCVYNSFEIVLIFKKNKYKCKFLYIEKMCGLIHLQEWIHLFFFSACLQGRQLLLFHVGKGVFSKKEKNRCLRSKFYIFRGDLFWKCKQNNFWQNCLPCRCIPIQLSRSCGVVNDRRSLSDTDFIVAMRALMLEHQYS